MSLFILSAASLALLAQAPAEPLQGIAAVPDAAALGAERCAGCHAHVVESYARTGMARALGPFVWGELEGLGDVAAGATGYSYRLSESAPESAGRRAWIEEVWRDPARAASEAVRTAAPIVFAVGAGRLDRSFVGLAHGRWFFAPLEVLSGRGDEPRRTALAPGHAVQTLARFSNPITEDCLACHTDRLPPASYPRGQAPADASWAPRGISCAACHGDVDAHAAWRESELAGERPQGSDPVLDHGILSLEERVSVCARCHLQGDARVALRQGARGLPPAGEDLLEHVAVLLPAKDDGEIAFVSQVERMVASRCYTASLGPGREPLSCETCHDPHRTLDDALERERVRSACLKCHASSPGGERSACTLPREERGEQGCADCHMRRTGVFDVAHVEIADHLIARALAPPRRTETPRILHTTDGELAAFAWPGRDPPDYAGDPGLALMAAMIARAPELARPLVDREPSAAVLALASYHHLRGVALEGLGRAEEAERAYREALRCEPDSPDSAVNLSLLLGRSERGAEGVRLLDAVLERHPAADNALRNRALLKLGRGDAQGFATDLEVAHRLRPDAALARALASLHAQRGDAAQADELAAEARRLAPHTGER